jgi:hypothetical protein
VSFKCEAKIEVAENFKHTMLSRLGKKSIAEAPTVLAMHLKTFWMSETT